jgi:hypothetical protein
MSAIFFAAIAIIVASNINTTRNILPLKENWIQMANLIAAGMLFFWGVRAGAIGGGGGMM